MAWLPIPDLGKGLNQDATGEELELGVQTSAQNMRFRHGYAERFKGMQSVFTAPPVTPYSTTHYRAGNSYFIVYAGLQQTYADDGNTQTEITNANNTGSIDDKWTCGVFNGIYIQNNGIDVPQYWNGETGTNLADLTAWPVGYRVGSLRAFGNFLVGVDVTRAGNRELHTVIWSNSTDPGAIPDSWDITDPTKDAGDFPLAETNGALIDSLQMGSMNILYKDDSAYSMIPVQGSAVFRFARLPAASGLMAKNCVVATPRGEHVLLTPGLDLVAFNGQSERSLIDGRMRTWLQANINQSHAIRSFLAVNPLTSEVLCCFPSGSATVCDKALVWNYAEDKVYVRDLPNVTAGSTGKVSITSATTWATASGTWTTATDEWAAFGDISGLSRLIFARASRLSMFDFTEQDHGSSFAASIQRTGMHFDSPETMKWIRAVRPKVDAAAGTQISVRVGWADVPDEDPTWSSPVTFTVGTDIEVFPSAQAGRFLALELSTTGDAAWRTRSCQMDVVPMGAY
jgi:hypothetical protein